MIMKYVRYSIIAMLVSMVLLFCMSALTGCGVDITGSYYTDHIYVDEETGVNYIWINTDSGVTMSPRFNADGTLFVTR